MFLADRKRKKEFKKSTLQTNASLLINLEQQLALPPRRVTTMNGSSDTSVSSSRNHHQQHSRQNRTLHQHAQLVMESISSESHFAHTPQKKKRG